MAGTLNDIYTYNFNGLTIPWPKLRRPRIDWDFEFLNSKTIQETIKFYYPKEWDDILDGLDIKHRYNDKVDSLAEGVKDIIDGYMYQFAEANGVRSHAEGVGTKTNNLAEHAEGKFNVSHTGNVIGGCNTISSIGIGIDDFNRKNAVEVMDNGDMYIVGIGNYDGVRTGCQNHNVKTLQEVIDEIESGGTCEVKGYVWSEDENSFAEGEPVDNNQPLATGDRSHAEGYGTLASGNYSHAEGYNDATNQTIDLDGHFGVTCEADMYFTISDFNAQLSAAFSTNQEILSALHLSIIGSTLTFVDSGFTFSSGYEYLAGQTVEIVGGTHTGAETYHISFQGIIISFEHEGEIITVPLTDVLDPNQNPTPVAELQLNVLSSSAFGAASHAEGGNTLTLSEYSHAEGYGTVTSNTSAHAEGTYTRATNISEHAEGQFNVSHSTDPTTFLNENSCNTVSSIGIGEDETHRKNAVEVMQNGDVYVYGVGGYNGTKTSCEDSSVKSLQETINSGGGGTGRGYVWTEKDASDNIVNSFAEGEPLDERGNPQPIAEGYRSHAEGSALWGTVKAKGDGSHVGGYAIEGGQIITDTGSKGGFATGYSLDNFSLIQSTDKGGFATGFTRHGGMVKSTAQGALAVGYSEGYVDSGETYPSVINASNDGSMALGYASGGGIITSSGDGSVAYGYVEAGEVLEASGTGSHAEGRATIAANSYAHAEGHGTMATGEAAHAEGINTKAKDVNSTIQLTGYLRQEDKCDSEYCDLFFSVADFNQALNTNYDDNGDILDAMFLDIIGSQMTLPNNTSYYKTDYQYLAGQTVTILSATHTDTETDYISFQNVMVTNGSQQYAIYDIMDDDLPSGASVTISISIPYPSAVGDASHVEGYNTIALSAYAHAEGYETVASGEASHAEGAYTEASGAYSHASGIGTIATEYAMTVVGKYNLPPQERDIFIVGGGSAPRTGDRRNAFTVKDNGDCYAEGVYYAASDARKKDVVSNIPLDKAYELVNKCQAVFYTWKSDEEKKMQIGLLAQEVQEYFPELVSTGGDGYLTLDYSRLTAILLTVIKDLNNRVSSLEALEERIKRLEEKQ